MLDYDIREVDILDPKQEAQVVELQNLAFNAKLRPGKIKANTYTDSVLSPSVYLGAFQGNTMTGFLGAISHDLLYNGRLVNAYQMVWGSTHPEHRGKRLFYYIEAELKKALIERKAAFIFGFPNDQAMPTHKKHGFVDTPMVKANIPANSFLRKRALSDWKDDQALLLQDTYLQNEAQLIKLKKQEYGDQIKVVEYYHNLIWGIILKRKIGPITVPFFNVGGMIINNPHLFNATLDQLFKQQPVQFARFILHKSNRYNVLFRKVEPAPHSEPLITFDLAEKAGPDMHFNFMVGVKDAYGSSLTVQ